MKAWVKPFFGDARPFEPVRVTKLWIVVRWNSRATGKFSRETGSEPGAFSTRMDMTPSTLVNFSEVQ